jgi:hypothetical protein
VEGGYKPGGTSWAAKQPLVLVGVKSKSGTGGSLTSYNSGNCNSVVHHN